MNYYNVVTLTDYQAAITYHNVSERKLKDCVHYILKNISAHRIFFYRLPYRESKKGYFCGYYHFKNKQIVFTK